MSMVFFPGDLTNVDFEVGGGRISLSSLLFLQIGEIEKKEIMLL